MKYCSDCAARLELKIALGDLMQRPTCTQCGRVHYENPKMLSSCTLYTHDRVLFIKRAQEPFAGLWQIPGGFVENYEAPEEAAAREVFEETRIKVDPSRLILSGILTVRHMNQVYLNYRCALGDQVGSSTEEASQVSLLSEGDLPAHEFIYPAVLIQYLAMFYTSLRTGSFGINSYILDRESARVTTVALCSTK
jgi:ADP-ribose pyrophosphatase YjhB (NUDIX family)